MDLIPNGQESKDKNSEWLKFLTLKVLTDEILNGQNSKQQNKEW